MRRQLLPLVAGLLALCTLTACLEDLGINIDDLAAKQTPLAQSQDEDTRTAAEAKREANQVKEANKAMNDFWATGDRAKLERAQRAQPNDIDISAAVWIEHTDSSDTSEEWFDKNTDLQNKMFQDAALARKARGLPPDDKAVRRDVAHATFDALARRLAQGRSGSFNANQPDAFRKNLYRQYCEGFLEFEAKNKDDPWLFSHHLDFGIPCKK